MKNERDIEFTPSPALPQSADFTPADDFGATSSGDTRPSENGAGTMGQARETAQRLVSTAQERARDTVQSRIDDQRHRAAHKLGDFAETLRGTTQQFQGDGIGRYLNEAADRVDHLATFLHDRELEEIVGEVEDFARRQPVAFLGGAFALGLLGARFLKSSGTGGTRRELREEWSTRDLTGRVDDPERDAVGRPDAPGYAPPAERATSDYKAAGPRDV